MPHMIRTLRLQRGWTVPQFAEKAGISIKIAYEIEKDVDYNMKWMTMKKVGAAFGIPTSVIFFPEEELKKRALMAGIFQHTIAVLRNMHAIREDRLFSTLKAPDSFPSSTAPSNTQESHISAAASQSQEVPCG